MTRAGQAMRRHLLPSPARAVAIVLVLGCTLTAVAGALVAVDARGDERVELEALTADAVGRLEARLDVLEQTLWTLAADMQVGDTNIDQFTAIVDAGRLTERAPGVHSLSFARELPRPGTLRQSTGAQRLIVERIVPIELGEGVVGRLDLYAEGERRRATQAARDEGAAAATTALALAYGGTGVLYYTPVYDGPARDLAERGERFLGVTIAVVDLAGLFDGVLGPTPLIDLCVLDLGPTGSDGALAPSTDAPVVWDTGAPAPVAGPREGPITTVTTRLSVADRTWEVLVTPTGVLLPGRSVVDVTVVAGLLLTALLAVLAATMLGARDRAEQLVAERTAELSEAYERLLEIDGLRQQFVATVSHELRTPLTAVLGFVQTLQRLGPDAVERRADFLCRAERQALLLRSMIEELLDFGRLERGEVALEPEPTDLHEALPQLVDDLAPVWHGRRVDVDADPGSVVLVDRLALGRVLGNLLANAIRYAPGDDPIEVVARALGDRVVVTVADRGPGVLDADLPWLFERFYRGTGVMGQGTGIGLAVVQGLMKAHGGEVSLANREDGGIVVTLELARVEAPVGAVGAVDPAAPTGVTA
jgi:signal transduction histidine kinase